MLIEAALMFEVQRTNLRIDERTARKYVDWIVEQATTHRLDPWLFFSLVYVESRWTAAVVRAEGDKSCSVGLGQINVSDCDPLEIERLQEPHENLRNVGWRLAQLRRICTRDCEGIRWLRGYNPGSKSYVSKVETVLERCHADYESPLREIPAGLHLSGVQWQSGDRTGRECGASAWRARSGGSSEPILCEVPQMSSLPDESDRRPAPSSTAGAGGILTSSDRVSFQAPGWSGAIWHCASAVVVCRDCEGSGLVWCYYDMKAVYLSQAAALALAQGAFLGALFPNDGYFSMEGGTCTGPFFFLSGRPSLVFGTPRVMDVVLARVLEAPPEISPIELVGRLVEQFLARR